jgi:hydroxypyruvate isomerase
VVKEGSEFPLQSKFLHQPQAVEAMHNTLEREVESRVEKYQTNPKLFSAFMDDKAKKEQNNAAYRDKHQALQAQVEQIAEAKALKTKEAELTVKDLSGPSGSKFAMNQLALEAKRMVEKRQSQGGRRVSFQPDDFDF